MESSDLGAFGKYAVAMLRAQLAVVRAQNEMQKEVVDMVLESAESLKVSRSPYRGNQADLRV